MPYMESIEAHGEMDQSEAQRDVDVANKGRSILAEDFEKYKVYFLDHAENITDKYLAALEEALVKTPENRDAVIRSWFEWLETVQSLQTNNQEKPGYNETVH